LVDWEDTAEASRAIVDAMPFLQMATEVSAADLVEGEHSPLRQPAAGARRLGWLVCRWGEWRGEVAEQKTPTRWEASLHRFLEETVADHMTTAVKTLTRSLSLEQLKKRFDADDFNSYPVVEHGEVLGLVTKFDFLKMFAMNPSSMVPQYNDLMKRTAGDAMTVDFIYVNPSTKLTRALQ
jgi:CBS domain-containing protein